MARTKVDFTGVDINTLADFVRSAKRLREFYETSKAYTFTPHPKQRLFFQPDREQFPRFRVFLGGNRTGKSECGALEAWSFAHGEHPWDGSPTPLPVPNRGRIVGDALLGGIKTVIEPKIHQLWPKDSIAEIKRGQIGNIAEVRFKNGSWLDILSCEQEPMRHEGADRDWIWFDEPPTEAHWISNLRGLVDRGGHAWMTLTPLKEPWILDKIINEAKKGNPNYFYVQSSMYDNVGYGLHEEQVREFESALSEEERMVRIHGEFLALQGMVYKEFRDHYFVPGKDEREEAGGHIVEPFTIPESWPRFVGCDPHDRIETMLLWIAVNEHQEAIVYDELAIPVMSIPEAAKVILEREKNQLKPSSRPIMRMIDPASARKNNVLEVGSNIKDQYMQNGVYFYSAHNDIDAGHKAVREYLKFDKTNRGYRPRLFVFDKCTNLRHALQRYTWDDWASAKEEQKKAPKPKPTEKFKHFPDALRYVMVTHPRYYEQKKSTKQDYAAVNATTGY